MTAINLTKTINIGGNTYTHYSNFSLSGNLYARADEINADRMENRKQNGFHEIPLNDYSDISILRDDVRRAFHRMAREQGHSNQEIEALLIYATNNVADIDFLAYLGSYYV